jgi:uncharacterized membrane protein
VPGLLLGIGFGGFVDGIVLHELLQWHHMLSDTPAAPMTTLAGMRLNTLADGLFHAGSWVVALTGTLLTVAAWRAGRRPPAWRTQVGLLLAGWGLFNVVEGVIDHLVLGVHHVRDDLGGPASWDLGFLALGALLTVCGWALQRTGVRPDEGPGVRR